MWGKKEDVINVRKGMGGILVRMGMGELFRGKGVIGVGRIVRNVVLGVEEEIKVYVLCVLHLSSYSKEYAL